MYQNYVFFSEMLARKSNSESLLENFRNCLGLSGDSSEDLMQQLYSSLMTRNLKDPEYYIALVKHKFLPLLKNKIDQRPFLECITSSRVPLNNIKKIQVRLYEISEKDWEAFNIQTLTGTVLQVQVTRSEYSPRIYEMLQSSRLTQFR